MADVLAEQEKYYRWYESEYSKCIGLNTLPERYPDMKLADAVAGFEYGYSAIWRHECLATMKYYAGVRKVEYIPTAFIIIRKGAKATYRAIYSFVYSYMDGERIVHEYTTAAPTFKSMDGEYRSRFISMTQFNDAYGLEPNLMGKLEDHVRKQIKDGIISFTTETRAAGDISLSKKVEKSINKLQLPIKLYIAAVICDYPRYVQSTLENHLAEGYVQAMFGKEDVRLYESMSEEIRKFPAVRFVRYYRHARQRVPALELGQKLISLTVKEVEECSNIQYSPWREAYISSLVGDLVINGIGPMFPIMNDWFFIMQMSTAFFDNPVNHVRAKLSNEASDIIKQLEEARQKTYVVDPIQKRELYFSYNMEGLSEAIEIPVEFAEAQIVKSRVGLVTLTEHIGRTLGDMITLAHEERFADTHGPLFRDYTFFTKYVFEFIYGIYCLNLHYGCIHTDLHLNNGTTFFKRRVINTVTKKPEVPNPHCIYEVGGSLYLFPHVGSMSAIIDYSRALLSRKHIKTHFDPAQVPEIIGDQKLRILRVYEQNLPDFYAIHSVQLEQALIINYDAVHRLTEAIDAYKISQGWLHIVEKLLSNPKLLDTQGDTDMLKNKAIPMVKQIHSLATGFLTVHMQKILQAPTNVDAKQIPHPNLTIIKEVFSEFRMREGNMFPKDATLIDYYRAENEIKYNVREYANFPPTVKLDYIKQHNVPGEMDAVKRFQLYEEYLKDPVEEKIAAVVDEVKASKPERRGWPEELRGDPVDPRKAKKAQAAVRTTIPAESYYES